METAPEDVVAAAYFEEEGVEVVEASCHLRGDDHCRLELWQMVELVPSLGFLMSLW
jgi:hypothetical protein